MGKRARPSQRAKPSKRAKPSTPPGPRASRVKKARAPRSWLPDWYYRVVHLRWDREPFTPTNPADFDEDLSELEEESEKEDCECDSEDSECDCQDDKSERSYEGSHADYYYELKEERDERKREMLEERLDQERDKKERFEWERSKEEEVRAAERSLRKVQKEGRTFHASPRSLADEEFHLFSSDHVNHFYHSGFYDVKFVDFFHPDDMPVVGDSDDPDVKSGDDAGMMYGTLFLDLKTSCKFGPFFPPSNATFRPVKVESCDGKYKLSLDFLGNGYLKLSVSRDMVFKGWNGKSPAECPPDAPAPEVFEFVGIWRDPKKEEAERQKMMEEMKLARERMELERQRRPPSPRESWFELNHPMGAYYDPRYAVDW